MGFSDLMDDVLGEVVDFFFKRRRASEIVVSWLHKQSVFFNAHAGEASILECLAVLLGDLQMYKRLKSMGLVICLCHGLTRDMLDRLGHRRAVLEHVWKYCSVALCEKLTSLDAMEKLQYGLIELSLQRDSPLHLSILIAHDDCLNHIVSELGGRRKSLKFTKAIIGLESRLRSIHVRVVLSNLSEIQPNVLDYMLSHCNFTELSPRSLSSVRRVWLSLSKASCGWEYHEKHRILLRHGIEVNGIGVITPCFVNVWM